MHVRQIIPAVALGALLAGVVLPAQAAVTVYYHVGAWDAFDGQGDDGAPVCGIGSHNPADGRAFSLRFQIGGGDVTFAAVKPGWTIPDGTHIPVVGRSGWNNRGPNRRSVAATACNGP
jgi:hypothetical protein